MRRFHSYGPVEAKAHYCVERRTLVQSCVGQLIGTPEEGGGHYFTIWAPRQTGKTWLMRQAIAALRRDRADEFLVGKMSMQGVFMEDDDPPDEFLRRVPQLMDLAFGVHVAEPVDWEAMKGLFRTGSDLFDRPVILLIDEFDHLPQGVIDRLVAMFRDIYLDRENHCLHALALIGVRAVMGVESRRGSPFNVQRSIHVPNLTAAEVTEMFDQYRSESGQVVETEVVDEVIRVTRGQPGLVGWFGELLTEKYNPDPAQALDWKVWREVYQCALHVEPNNTVLNLLAKAREQMRDRVLQLYARPDQPFDFDATWCNYLYMNGIIAPDRVADRAGNPQMVCRFSTPFIQERLYNALTADLVGDGLPILPLDPLDDLADVFTGHGLNVPKLLDRYRSYLVRLEAAGINPWQDQPRRKTDLQLQEAVGHFHLYSWLQAAIGWRCLIAPEFPTGNGKVDLHLTWEGHRGLIEIKSFVDRARLEQGLQQAARYARQSGLDAVTVAVFMPVKDERVLAEISRETRLEDVTVTVAAIGWM